MKTRWMLFAAVLATSAVGCKKHHGGHGGGGGGGMPAPQTDEERALYSLGVMMAQQIDQFHLTPHELAVVQRGMSDQVTGAHKLVETERFLPRLRELARTRQAAQSQVTRQNGQRFLDQAAAEPGAQRLPSGMIFRELAAGEGAQPTAADEVVVNYRGTLTDGTEFDSSYSRHQPATFRLGAVIPCWTEGLQHMHAGGRAKLVCPPDLAYGDRGQRVIPPGSTLVFEVELVEVHPHTAAPAAPPPAVPQF